jgi:hypothetical protein
VALTIAANASTRPVLNDEWLAKAFRQPLAHQTCDDNRIRLLGAPAIKRTGRDG